MSARWREALGEFVCGFFLVSIGFPLQLGWAFVAYAGMSNAMLMKLSVALGVLAGSYMAWECISYRPGKETYEKKRSIDG